MKGSGVRRGIEQIKTSRSKGLRSIPREQDDCGYLDLYVLDKERERLEKELSQAGKKMGKVSKRLREIKLRMKKLKRKSEDTKKNEETAKETVSETNPKKDWKIMNIDY